MKGMGATTATKSSISLEAFIKSCGMNPKMNPISRDIHKNEPYEPLPACMPLYGGGIKLIQSFCGSMFIFVNVPRASVHFGVHTGVHLYECL